MFVLYSYILVDISETISSGQIKLMREMMLTDAVAHFSSIEHDISATGKRVLVGNDITYGKNHIVNA